MKKLLLLSALLTIAVSGYGQYKIFEFGEYKYNTECHYNRNNFVTIKIDMQSLDPSYSMQLMIGTEKAYNNFMERLKFIKAKMIEWDSVCIVNNIDKIDKLIEYKVGKKEEPSVWFGKYYNSTPMLCAYARENNTSRTVFHTGVVSALSNEYIKSKGGVIVFYSPKDVDEMIKAFDLIEIQKYIDEKNKKVNLLQ